MKKKYLALSFLLGTFCSVAHASEKNPDHLFRYVAQCNIEKKIFNPINNILIKKKNTDTKSYSQEQISRLFMDHRYNSCISIELSYEGRNEVHEDKNIKNKSNDVNVNSLEEQKKYVRNMNKKNDDDIEKEFAKDDVDQNNIHKNIPKSVDAKIPSPEKKSQQSNSETVTKNRKNFLLQKKIFFEPVKKKFNNIFSLSTKFSCPTRYHVDLYARCGVSVNIVENITKYNNFVQKVEFQRQGFHPVLACGIEYKFNKYASASIELKKLFINNNPQEKTFPNPSFKINLFWTI
ncbi:hypothetical protein [Buchnera aphidicola]|uniref:hypothetical protein n=1 Tax=Buchnera aphidicola TaxID=9 RepID=UPI002093BA1F|nr:hypothetical protein [Buchnera aphidicola]USS94349.1 hypothetical protein M3Y47_00695 [Buchnera aphidicola (Sipha maydis)]